MERLLLLDIAEGAKWSRSAIESKNYMKESSWPVYTKYFLKLTKAGNLVNLLGI
jgi:hypothetical protein